MPNFWLVADIDGQQRPLRGGPKTSEGGFNLAIKVADSGVSTTALTITGRAYHDNRLILRVYQGMALIWRGEWRKP